VIGLVAITAAGGALILYPACLARRLVPALGGGLVLAVPQALTMAGIDAPSWIGAVFVAAGIGTAFVLAFVVGALADRGSSDAAEDAASAEPDTGTTHDDATDWASTAEWGRAALVGAAIAALLIVARSHIPQPGDPASEVMIDFPHLVWLCLGGVALSVLRLGRGWIVLGCGIAAGLAAWAASGLVGYADLTQQSVHYEVPKSVEYWLPVMLAIGSSAALAAVSRQRRLGLLGPVVIGVFLLVAVYPTTLPLATNVQIGEHRASESVGLALREAERGYWDLGYPGVYPDARLIIDAPRQEVVDELRSEEAAIDSGPAHCVQLPAVGIGADRRFHRGHGDVYLASAGAEHPHGGRSIARLRSARRAAHERIRVCGSRAGGPCPRPNLRGSGRSVRGWLPPDLEQLAGDDLHPRLTSRSTPTRQARLPHDPAIDIEQARAAGPFPAHAHDYTSPEARGVESPPAPPKMKTRPSGSSAAV
jgi:hypothetical protein